MKSFEFELTRTITQVCRVTFRARSKEDAVNALNEALDSNLDEIGDWQHDSEEVDFDGPLE